MSIHKGIVLSHQKDELSPFAMTWVELLESLILSEIHQRKTNTSDVAHVEFKERNRWAKGETEEREEQTEKPMLTYGEHTAGDGGGMGGEEGGHLS